MTRLDDEEVSALQRASLEAQRKLDEQKAAEARGDAPSPFAAALGGVISKPETAADLPPPTPTFEPLPVRPWWCGNPECRMPGPWRPYPFCDHCAEVDRRARVAAHVQKATAAGDRGSLVRLRRQALAMGHADEAAQVLAPLLELVRADLPPVTEGATLGADWLIGLVGAEAHREALAYAGAPGWLLLEGPSRAGKTSLAAAVYRALTTKAARPGASEMAVTLALGLRFIPARLLRKAQQEHKLGAGEAPLLVETRRASLLVLDDLGNEGPDRGEAVGDVLFDRHNARLPTIVTTGLGPLEVENRYGAGINERLREGVKVHLGGGRK